MKHLYIFLFAIFSTLVQGQINWQSTEINQGSTLNKMHVFDNTTAIITGSKSTLKRTTDAGLNWLDVDLPDTIDALEDVFFSDMQFQGDTGFLVHRKLTFQIDESHSVDVNSNILVSFNKGIDWQIVNYSGTDDGSNDASKTAFADSSYNIEIFSIGVNTDGKLFISLSWDEKNGSSKTDHSYIYSTTDVGTTWVKEIDIDFGSAFINALLFDENHGFIGGNKVLYAMQNGGEWTDISADLVAANDNDANFYVNDFTIANNKLFIPTTSDGVFTYDFNSHSMLKISDVGTNDIFYINANSFFAFGTTSRTYLVKDGEVVADASLPGVTIFDVGGVLGENVYALANTYVYYFNKSDIALSAKHIDGKQYLKINRSSYRSYRLEISQGARMEVYALNGRLHDSKAMIYGVNHFNMYNQQAGIYILRFVFDDGKIASRKLVVE